MWFTEHHTVKEMSETAATGPEPNQEHCASKACRIPASTGDRIFLIILLVDGRTTAMCCCSSQLRMRAETPVWTFWDEADMFSTMRLTGKMSHLPL